MIDSVFPLLCIGGAYFVSCGWSDIFDILSEIITIDYNRAKSLLDMYYFKLRILFNRQKIDVLSEIRCFLIDSLTGVSITIITVFYCIRSIIVSLFRAFQGVNDVR